MDCMTKEAAFVIDGPGNAGIGEGLLTVEDHSGQIQIRFT